MFGELKAELCVPCGFVRGQLVVLVVCALYYRRLNALAGRRKVRIQGMCFSWGYKAWCDGRGEKSFSFFVSVVRRLTFKEALLSNKTLEILLNLCLYPEELVQTATVGSPSGRSGQN